MKDIKPEMADFLPMEESEMKASDCKCIKCGQQAVAFWPVIDPDIPSHPYCRKCLDKEKLKAMIAMFGEDEGRDLFKAWNNPSVSSIAR